MLSFSKQKRGKASDLHGMRYEFPKVLNNDPAFLPRQIYYARHCSASLGVRTTLVCLVGTRALVPCSWQVQTRPVQVPDMFRAVVTSFLCGIIHKSREALNFLETGAGSYRVLSVSSLVMACVVKETQRLLEDADAL